MSKLAFTITPIAFLLTCAAAQATPADPHVIFDTAIAGLPVRPADAFSLPVNANGGGVFNFQNISHDDWLGVHLFVTLPLDVPIDCKTHAFYSDCGFMVMQSKTPGLFDYEISFIEPTTVGVLPGTVFSINLNNLLPNGNPDLNPKGSGGWGSNNMVGAVTTLATPEPTSLLLIGGGVALLGILRRSRNQQRES